MVKAKEDQKILQFYYGEFFFPKLPVGFNFIWSINDYWEKKILKKIKKKT